MRASQPAAKCMQPRFAQMNALSKSKLTFYAKFESISCVNTCYYIIFYMFVQYFHFKYAIVWSSTRRLERESARDTARLVLVNLLIHFIFHRQFFSENMFVE